MDSKPRNKNGNQWVTSAKSYDWLLKYDSVKDWIASYSNERSRKNLLHSLNRFFKGLEVDPKQFVELDAKSAKQLIIKVINEIKAEKKLAQAILVRHAVKSLYNSSNEYNGKPQIQFLDRKDKIPKMRKKALFEQIPSKIDIFKMLDYWNQIIVRTPSLRALRNRAMILTHFETGVRPAALCNLTVGMVRSNLYPEIAVPITIKVTSEMDTKLSGYSLDYYCTFIWTKECARYLKELIEFREKREGKLKDTDYLFSPSRINSVAIHSKINKDDYNTDVVKRTAKLVSLDPTRTWSHLIRKSFRKVLNATIELDEDTREAVMGHRLPASRENYFDRHDLTEVIEKMRHCDFNRPNSKEVVEEEFMAQLAERDKEIRDLRGKVSEMDDLKKRLKDLEIIYQEKLKVT
jgi:integrase